MNPALKTFVRQFIAVVAAALVPVILVAFLWLPVVLGGHPGEPRNALAQAWQHLS